MKNWQTKIEKFELPNAVLEQNLVFLGSCFAENIGIKLQRLLQNTSVNQLGIVYNPESLYKIIDRCVGNVQVKESELEENNGLFHHMDFHGSFSHSEPIEVTQKINESLSILKEQLIDAEIIYLSLGTANVFVKRIDDETVNNCHKFPSNLFIRKLLSYSNIVHCLNKITDLLLSLNPDIKIVFTVSPIRHLRDGLIENSRSKSVLNASIKEVVHQSHQLFYFPAYEIMMDELRDYRFYADDMVHPSKIAIDHIFEVFLENTYSAANIQTLKKIEKISQFISHRPIHAFNENYPKSVESVLNKLSTLQKENPKLDLQEIQQSLTSLLI